MARHTVPFRLAAPAALLTLLVSLGVFLTTAEPERRSGPLPEAPLSAGGGDITAGAPARSVSAGSYSPLWRNITASAEITRRSAVKLAVFPNVFALSAGESVMLPLDNGETVEGRVVLVTEEEGIRRVGGELSEGKGGFSFGSRPGWLEGSVIFKSDDRAVLYAGNAFQTEALAAKASELMCRGLPAAPPRERPERGAVRLEGPIAAPPPLSSRPSASHVLYLDFDGATVVDPSWYNGRQITAAASGLTDTEISLVWRRVREDFIPFNVDVTTIESRYTNAPPGKRMRCIVTASDAWFNDNNERAGGVAYLNSFSRAATTEFSSTVPCWAFSGLFNDAENVAEVISHELGHTLGLSHDGTASEEYYAGHAYQGRSKWAPIMGVGYDVTLVQWSRGEYPGANNREDDLAIIAGQLNGFRYVADEAGGTAATAAELPVRNAAVNTSGVITGLGDTDLFRFSTAGGDVSLAIRPYTDSPNLDISATLETAGGTVVASSNPDGPAAAVISTRLGTPGMYFLRVAGTGFGNAASGYTSYGSVGDYTIVGAVPTAPPEIVVEANPGGPIESRAGYSFGDVVSGTSRSVIFTVRNSGLGNLISLALSKSGSGAGDFTVTPLEADALEPGSSTGFTVTFSPRETGSRSALLTIDSNDPDENSFEIPLTANGTPAVPPDIIVTNASGNPLVNGDARLVVGNTLPGVVIRRTIRIRNDGLTALSGLVVTKDGADAADFTVTQPVPASLNFGQASAFEVTFKPLSIGSRAAALHIASNDPDESPFTISLGGAGVASGASDAGFDTGLTGKVYTSVEQPDGKMLIGGDFSSIAGGPARNIARLLPDGTPDTTFQCGVNDFVYCLAVQPDGKILAGGQFYEVNGIPRNRLARLNADGSLDTAFNPDAGGYVYSMALLPDGKIMVGGAYYQIGGQGRANIARLLPDGSADPAFTGGVNDFVYSLAMQEDGKVVIGGGFTQSGTTARNRVARLTAAGALDAAFNPNANGNVFSVAVQPDGKILLGGAFTTLGATPRNRIARLTAAGAVEAAFRPEFNDNVYSLSLQADGKILAGGWFTTAGAAQAARITRLNADGTPDAGFKASADAKVFSVNVLQDGSVLAGGFFQNSGDIARQGLVKLLNAQPTGALSVPSSTTVEWLRGGTAPELTQVTFETSADGEQWNLLGKAARISGGWRLTGQTLNGLGRLRARGRTVGGLASGSGGIVQEIVNYGTAPEISVEQPAGVSLADNDSTVDFGLHSGGAPFVKQFTVWNFGSAPLTGLSLALSGAQAGDYSAGPLPAASLNAGESLVFTVSFTPGGGGSREAELRIASNDADENPFRLRLTGARATPYLMWKMAEFGTAANSGPSADDADRDGDGISTLMEYGLGLDPDLVNPVPAAISLEGETLRFSYARSAAALEDLLFTVEWAGGPDASEWSTAGVTETVANQSGGVQQVTAGVPAGAEGRRFVRLRVTGR